MLSYMLGLVDHDILIKLLMKSCVFEPFCPTPRFKPGTEVFNDFINNYTNDTKFRKLFIFDVPLDVTEDQIRDTFTKYGEIEDIRLVTDPSSNRSKGYGFIVFVKAMGALCAISHDNTVNV